MNDWSNRKQKEFARTFVVSPDSGTRKQVLMLPSKTMECVREAESSGLFNKDTQCLCVERDLETFNVMIQTSKPLISQIVPIHSDLHNVDLVGNYDYAFFDLNGPLTIDIANWMNVHFSKHIDVGADIAFTFLYAYRNNHFIHELHNFVTQPCMQPYLRETSIKCGGVADETVAMYLLLFRLIFNKFDFVIDTPIKYRDTQSMLIFFLKDFRYGGSGIPTEARCVFEHFMKQQLASRRNEMSNSEAATKAWATRQANKKFAKRSKAATKAWITRRSKKQSDTATKKAVVVLDESHHGGAKILMTAAAQLAKKRSEAAKKSWETRRANAQ